MAQCSGNMEISILGLFLVLSCFGVVLSDYELTQGSLVLNSSEGFFHFCEFPVLPVAVYPFNNETLANDVSPHKAVGELVGTTFSPGINGEPGGSIEVQGRADSYIELSGDARNLNIKPSITILLHVYPMGSPGPIVNYKKDGHGVQIYETDSALAARINQRNDGRTQPVETETRLQRDQWHFIGMTYNYSSGLVKLWQEGREVASRDIRSIQIATQFDVRIGARQIVNDDFFRGRVACLQFYSTALAQRKIQKARIACKPFEPVSTIYIKVRHEDKYIEVNESVSVEVRNDKNLKFNEYKYDMGDGSPLVTTDQDFNYHSYSKHGDFVVQAIIYSRCRNETLRVRATVTVEKPVELLGNLTLSCDPVPFPSSLSAVLTSTRGTDFKCYWNFSDGHVSETNFADQGLIHKLKRTFNATGTYLVHVSCENRLSRVNVTSLVIVQVPVKGLIIDKITPKAFLRDFRVTWHVQSGSDVDYTASFANKDLKIFKDQNASRGWALVRRHDHMGPGIFDVTVKATNKVSGILQATEMVRIEKEVQPFVPTVFPLNKDIEVNETLSLFVTTINEVNAADPVYHIDLGDGRKTMNTKSLTVNFSYPDYGNFLVTVNASNNVSFYNTSILITVHKPVLLIEDLTLTTKPTTFLKTTVITARITGASDVVCTSLFDDIPNYSKEFDLRAESAWDPVRLSTDGNVPDVKFFITRNYTKVGVYYVKVSCKNRLSQRNATINVTVQELVTGARLIPIKPVTLGKPINISLELSSGTNVSFELDFNGYKFQQKMKGLSTFHVINQDVYHSASFHKFTVTVWNLVTFAIEIRGHVIVEVPIYGLEAYVTGGTRDIEVNETVNIVVILINGSNPEFVFDFKDGSELFASHSHVVDYKFNPHSLYEVNVTARNYVSQEFALVDISVVKPVLRLKGLSVSTSPTGVNDAARLVLRLTEGSDFFCLWQFGDGLILNSSYEHLSFYSDGKTTDKRPFQNLTFLVQHKYKSAGIFPVSVSCQNRLSSEVTSAKIVIQTLIKGLNIIKIPTQVVGQEFQVSWNILSGTNATFNVTIDRGSVTSIHSSALEGFAKIELSTPGQYTIWVSAHNLVSPIQSRSAEITAEVPVSNVTVNVTCESRDLEMNQNATFTVGLGTGTSPVFVFYFGDGYKVVNKLGQVTYEYGFNDVYSTQPSVTYQVRVEVYNNISSAVSLLNVTVHRPVLRLQDVKLSAFPSNVSENARIILSIQQGSDALCVCDFGDGSIPRELNLSKNAFLGADRTPVVIFRNQSYQIGHVYQKVSKYHLLIECRNRLSYERQVTEIAVQEPIRDLEISDIPPRLFNETLVISWQIANGTDVSFRFFFANLGFQEFGKRRNITVRPGDYKVSGVFRVLIVARNLVSQVVARATAIIQHSVSIQNVTARIPQIGGSRGGYGFLGKYFPAGRDVTFEVIAQGSDLSYQWQIDNEMEKFTKETLINHRFYRVGLHNLTVLARNMVSDAYANISILIQYAIEDPVLESNSPQKVKQPIKFHLSAAQLGTDSCFSVDFGDGTHSLRGHPGCKARNSTANFTVISAVESVKFEHVYSQIGEYNVLLNASNEVSFVQVGTVVEVEYAPCASPDIEVENLGADSKTASKSFRSDPYVVRTHIHLDCERTNKVKFKWKLLLLDENGAQSTNHDNIILTERELNIPRKGLAYGLYEVHFTAQMALPNTNKYRSTAIGYLRIVPSPLVAKIDGGNLISRGFGKAVNIDASPSKDPDVDRGKDSGLHYTWLCRSVHTQFPEDVFPKMNLRTPYDTTSQPALPGTAHTTGCYGDGEFVFAGSNASMSLNTTGMMEDETYVVFVIIRKGARTAHQYQVVEVIQGDPPVSRLDCKQNCANKICPSKRFSLVASCFEGCIGRLIYEWKVYKKVGNGSVKSWQLQTDILQNLAEVKDPKGPVFTLPKNVLQGSSEYLIRLYGRREKGIKGKTESVFLTNEVPKGGACFGSPTSGDALVTNFYIWCEGWEDPDKPLSYEFYYKNDEGKLILFYYGFHNSTYSELPLGNPALDYTLEIHVKVLDFFKGAAHYDLLLQSVEPEMEEEQLGDKLSNMTLGENSDLSKLVNVGDSQAVLRMAGAVNSLLNSQSSKSPSNDTEGEDTRKEKRTAVRTSVIKAATSLPVTSLEGLQQTADMIASASMFKDETSTAAMNASNEAFARMTALLKSSSDDFAGYDAVVSSAESLLSGMGQVLNAAGSSVNVKPKKMNATKAPPTCGPYEFTCKEVDNEEPRNMTEDDAVELDEESSKSRDAANNIVGMLGSVSGSVLENMLPGEQPSVISTAKLNMAVERSDPDSTGGSSIGDGLAGFRMPSFGKLFSNSSSDLDAPVDKQMAAINENPYTWDKRSSSITGKVVSLSFKSKGQKINVAHLDKDDPIDVFLPRDSPVKPPEKFIYNCSVHQGWRIHKLVMNENGSAVNVEVSVVGSRQHFVVYVRRGKAPTTTEFDWRMVSPNLTDNMRTDPNMDQRYPNATEPQSLRANTTNQDPKALNVSSNSTEALNQTINQENNHTTENTTSATLKSTPKIQQSKLTVFLSQRRLYVGTYYIGIKFSAVTLENEQTTECTGNDSIISYSLRTLKSRCLYWNEEFQKWKTDGCEVGNLTNATQTHCRCTHLTAFGSMMDVAPNPIDFSAVAAGFSSMLETGNVVVFAFIVAMFLFYVLVLVWSRRADKRDTEQAGATPISGNEPNATYHYELTFFTGQRRGAGTTAQVSCKLAGEHGESGICILKDKNRPTFKQGSTNSFIISVDDSLGTITSLSVWHNNHGLSPAWFLKRVLLHDLQSDACVVFICERWFALEEDDGVITRELTPAGEEDLTSFSRLFSSKLYKDFTDAHLWFSVLLKPSRSTFTRAQRASCCLCLLCTAMVSSAMFYGQTGAEDESGSLFLGPIEINLRSVMIGIQCSLVIIPVNVAIVTIFKSLKVKGAGKKGKEGDEQSSNQTISTAEDEFSEIDERTSVLEEKLSPDKEVDLDCVQCEINDSRGVEGDYQLVMENPSRKLSSERHWFFRNSRVGRHKYMVQANSIDSKSSEDVEDSSGSLREERDTGKWWCCRKQRKDTKVDEKDEAGEEKKRKKAEGFLPYWCLYVAWFLCIAASFASALFTLFYSMMWGKEKSNHWFFSMILTFSQDTFINQPAKVLLLSTAYAIFVRRSDEETEVEQSNKDPRKGQDEEWLHDNDILDTDDRQKELLRYQPPDESKLSALRETKIREKQLKNKFMKLFDYLFILLVLILVSYGNRDPQSFLMRNSMEQEFIHPLTVSYPQGLDDVNNLPLFLKWGEQSLIPHLYEQDWYNGDKVKNRTGFTSGRVNKRLGRMRLRQARIQNGSCKVHKLLKGIIPECNPPYEESYQDTRMYSPGWRDGFQTGSALGNKRSTSGQLSPWVYLDPTESNSSVTIYGRIAFYPGGGYVAEFGDSVEEAMALIDYLKSTRWVDRYTRSVIIEGAIYNPNTNLIGVVETAVEVTSATAFLPRVDFKIFRLFATLNPSFAFNSACEILFFVILLYTLYTIIKGIYSKKKEYFRHTISWLDMIFFVNCFAIVVMYIARESKLKSAMATLKIDQEWFINFSECGLYNEATVYLYAFADFIAILRFINFLSFTRCVQLLSTTIYRSLVELQSFAVMLFTIFMAFASMAFTIYGPYLEDYRSVSATLASLTSIVMGVFDYTDFTSHPDYKAVGYFFFVTFSSSMMFIFTNVVITIINVVHKTVRGEGEMRKNDADFFKIILDRLLIFTGFRGPPTREEPVICDEPSIAELQWNWHVQYVMDNQINRLNGLVNSIYNHDEMEEISLLRVFPPIPEVVHKPVTGYGYQGNQCNMFSNAATDGQIKEPEQERGENDKMNISNQGALIKESDQQLPNVSASESQKTSIETISDLITKKTEELKRLEKEGACDETERLRRVKVIRCLQDLLNRTMDGQHSTKLYLNHDEESDV